ncbi:peptidoglycan-binding protein [Alkalihalobacterium chitinilyticum]|uniref:Peptidoglycan-binding protein n=1 Tax=Alkalihalobacterium chitinilyticum TaxID=2980103 RepID=A0ABT5VNH4_9BACI|nr:peptidoglycan-binding protein [Alkalihalobacterium chitinilyticum]MDE5415829.1 peptidoglycan-binding protein [Alkalihalobacterium chitinilyticum]
MKKVSIFLVLWVLVLSSLHPAFATTIDEPEKLIVVFKDEIIEDLITDLDGEVLNTFEQLTTAKVELPLDAITELENHEDVLMVEFDQPVWINTQTVDWGMEKVKAPLAWQSDYTGKGVKIAVLDTGIANHRDLVIAGGKSFTSTNTSAYQDDNGHGTHVAGIIGARDNGLGTIGVAPDAQLYAVKVLRADGNGFVSDIISGIDWAIANSMDIINLSLGTKQHLNSFKQAVDKAESQGILVVAAAGNEGTGTGDTVEFPARYNSVIAVSAIDINESRGSFSASGPAIEVTAPGVNIYSTSLNNGYTRSNGTSIATAFATGVLALLKEAHPNLTAAQYRKMLQDMAVDIGQQGRDEHFGYGIVQAPFLEEDQQEFKLRVGDVDDRVIELKHKLIRLGFGGMNVNAVYGSFTAQRVSEFQAYYGLRANGVTDQKIFDKLDQILSTPYQEGVRYAGTVELKQKLNSLGYGGMNLNDMYGSFTALRVRQFQADHGLKSHGIADEMTLAKIDELYSKLPNFVLQVGDVHESVIDLKRKLIRLDFGGMSVNATYGSFTAQRVRQFQEYYGLPANGITDSRTIEKLDEILSSPFQDGVRHKDTIFLKKKLQWLGLGGMNLNDMYGSFTALRVSQFQANHGLKSHGIADEKTLDMMTKVLPTIFQVGSVHDSVIPFKRDITRLGFGGMNLNRVYGSFTAQRVRELQAYYGLEVTGRGDIATLTKIDEILSSPFQTGKRHESTIELKEQLTIIGYGGMNINPMYGSFTAQRVREFQEDHGLIVNGIVDDETFAKIEDWTQ